MAPCVGSGRRELVRFAGGMPAVTMWLKLFLVDYAGGAAASSNQSFLGFTATIGVSNS